MTQPSKDTIFAIAGLAAACASAEPGRHEPVEAMSEASLSAWIEHCWDRLMATDMQYLLASSARATWATRLLECESERERRYGARKGGQR